MNPEKQAKLEAKGYKVTTVAEFLNLTPEESEIIETRLALCKLIRKLRAQSSLTQAEVAVKVKTGQARIAKIEAADPSISTDFLLRTLYALGASRKQVAEAIAA